MRRLSGQNKVPLAVATAEIIVSFSLECKKPEENFFKTRSQLWKGRSHKQMATRDKSWKWRETVITSGHVNFSLALMQV